MSQFVLTAQEFEKIYTQEADQWEVVDVREEWETNLVSVKSAKKYPLSQIVENGGGIASADIDWSRKIAFICRSGGRSAQAMRFFADHENARIYNVVDGVESLYRSGSNIIDVGGDEDAVKEYIG